MKFIPAFLLSVYFQISFDRSCLNNFYRNVDSFSDIFIEEFLNLCKWDDVLLIIEVGVACAWNDHEELVVGFCRGYGKPLVGVTTEIERVGFLSVKNHDGVFNFAGTAHQWEVRNSINHCS